MKEIPFHPIADIFPLMEGKPFDDLKSDIKEHGLRDKILLAGKQIADGRNRYLACREVGVEPEYETWDGEGSLLSLVLSRNKHRRHLDASQLAMVAAKSLPFFEEEAEKRRLSNLKQGDKDPVAPIGANGKAVEQAAESVGATPRSVERAKQVLDKGASALVHAVEAGEVSVTDAATIVDAPKAEQAKAVAAVKSGKARTVRSQVKPAKPAKPGSPTTDTRKFKKVRDDMGKLIREFTELKEHAGGVTFYTKIRSHMNEIVTLLSDWQKQVTK